MTTHYDADVAVIGYGPTALITTLTLAKQGASVIAFEKEKSIYPRARAVTVNDWTVRIFQDLGIADRILKVIEAQRGLRWLTYDGTEIMRVMHPESTLGHNVRFYNIYQPTMEAELRAAGEEMYGDRITVHYGDEVTGLEQDEDGVTVTSTTPDGGTRTVRAKYVVGADGGKSFTRRHIGTTMIGDAMPSLWIVVDCFSKRWWPDRDFLTFWSDKERPVVDIALSAGAHRWELTLKPTESEADYQTEDQVWPLLEAIGHNKDDMTIHQWAFYYHAAQIGDHWRQGRIFLAGDACHLTRPFAGAGMQTGMRDGHNLGWKLGRVISGELDPAWLDTYEAERKPNAKYFIDLAVVLGKVIEQTATPQEMSWLNDPDPSFVVTPWEPALNRPPVLE
ncbi:MAG: FAD-dependent monooxygenase, partial [Propionibacteriaceae bacterium]|nr:FAD-dependent monooxygenase [Propionibacteriaceae bacterium]